MSSAHLKAMMETELPLLLYGGGTPFEIERAVLAYRPVEVMDLRTRVLREAELREALALGMNGKGLLLILPIPISSLALSVLRELKQGWVGVNQANAARAGKDFKLIAWWPHAELQELDAIFPLQLSVEELLGDRRP